MIMGAASNFADLALEREPVTHCLLFLPAPLGALCLFNGLDPEAILANEDLSCELICEWYFAHIEAGGEPDPVAEQILEEVVRLQDSGIAMLQNGGNQPL
jgi:hypothetical protein